MCSEERLLRPLHLASSVSWSLRRTTCSESAEGDVLEAMYSGRAACSAWMAEASSLQSHTVTSWRVCGEKEGVTASHNEHAVHPKQPSQTNESHLIGQDGERPLQPTGGSVLGRSGKTLGVVADLSLERVDVGDDLFGANNVLGYVDDGLWAGEGAAAESRDRTLNQRVNPTVHCRLRLISPKCSELLECPQDRRIWSLSRVAYYVPF